MQGSVKKKKTKNHLTLRSFWEINLPPQSSQSASKSEEKQKIIGTFSKIEKGATDLSKYLDMQLLESWNIYSMLFTIS